MDQPDTPWRAIESHGPASVGRDPAGTAASEPRRPAVPPWPVVGAVGAAIGLIALAAALAMNGSGPAVIVPTDVGAVAATGEDAGSTGGPGGLGADRPVAPTALVVHVAGAVRRPGLVTLPAGARVADAIAAAGGLGPRADAELVGSRLNLAAPVSDGERIVVPSRDDPTAGGAGGADGGPDVGASSGGGGSGAVGPDGLVDLNRATADELEALPGIGEASAAKIVEARAERPFRTVEELLERGVVGRAIFEKARPHLVVR